MKSDKLPKMYVLIEKKKQQQQLPKMYVVSKKKRPGNEDIWAV